MILKSLSLSLYIFFLYFIVVVGLCLVWVWIIIIWKNCNMPVTLDRNQLYEEYNSLSTFELTILAQELVQETIYKTTEVAQLAQGILSYLVRNDQSTFVQKKARIEDSLANFDNLFLRLRVAGQIISQRKEETRQSTATTTTTTRTVDDESQLNRLREERDSLAREVKLRNDYLKYTIDRTSEIIWQINAMQSLKQ